MRRSRSRPHPQRDGGCPADPARGTGGDGDSTGQGPGQTTLLASRQRHESAFSMTSLPCAVLVLIASDRLLLLNIVKYSASTWGMSRSW